MKKKLIFTLIIGFSLCILDNKDLMAFTIAPQGETTLMFNNSANADILVASTCSKNPDAQAEAKKGQQATLQVNLGAPCKIIAVVKNDPTSQAVMCLDEWGCHQHCLGGDPECVDGACDDSGIGWVRGCGGGQCKQYQKPGLVCGRDNCDICIRGVNNSLSYGIALRYSDIVYRMIKGGNIRFAMLSILGDSLGKMMVDKIGMGPAYDFPNAVWKITELNYYAPQTKDAITSAFCSLVVGDPDVKRLYNEKPGSRDTFQSLCPAQANILNTAPPAAARKGDSAGNGYIWNNPPSYAVKCDSGAYLRADKGGCECPAGKRLIQLPVDISLPGVQANHWGCQ